MRLVPCSPPTGDLESAPVTALQPADEAGLWEGFWANDDSYLARCTNGQESPRWFRYEEPSAPDQDVIADERAGAVPPQNVPERRRRSRSGQHAAVVAPRRARVVLVGARGGRAMVGRRRASGG